MHMPYCIPPVLAGNVGLNYQRDKEEREGLQHGMVIWTASYDDPPNPSVDQRSDPFTQF